MEVSKAHRHITVQFTNIAKGRVSGERATLMFGVCVSRRLANNMC